MDSLTLDCIHGFEVKNRPTGDEVDEWRLLTLDNHSSHLTLAFLDYAATHHIEVVGYIPNSTHILQGLDVAVLVHSRLTTPMHSQTIKGTQVAQ